MRNKYSGMCYRCGELVKPGEGHFQRTNGKWLVQHAEGAIICRNTNIGITDPLIPRVVAKGEV